MLHTRLSLAAALAALALGPAAQAHRAWFAPSATVLSGADPWVTMDAAISNDLFYADHNALRMDGVKAYGPDGQPVAIENAATGKFRSTFDLHLTRPGTYKVVSASDTMAASYKLGQETKRWRGPEADLAAAIPQGAAEVKVSRNQRLIETFVTAGAPTTAALRPAGKGLEAEWLTHPNDLVASEKARFRLLQDGRPAAGVEVEVVMGAGRYRKAPELKLTSGADGVVEIAWPEPGMYWIEAGARTQGRGGVETNLTYVATLEVLPD